MKEVNYEKYIRDRWLVGCVSENGILEKESFSRNIDLKKEILREYGYDVLYGLEGSVIDIDDCTDARVHKALFKTYRNAQKNVEKFEKQTMKDPVYRNLAELLMYESDLEDEELVDAQERTAIFLDSTPKYIRDVLGRKFGKRTLGLYAVK